MTANRKIIVVLGMHRSGTSAVARGLKVLGVELGNRLMPPVAGENDKGFWEDLDIYGLNEEMLEAVGRGWWSLLPLTHEDLSFLLEKGYDRKAAELLAGKIAASTVYGFKDPRFNQLLELWKKVFSRVAGEVEYVLVVRDPRSVVRSVCRRNGFPPEVGSYLWAGQVLSMLAGTKGEKRILLDYDQLLEDPALQLGRLSEALGLDVMQEELRIYSRDFLDPALNHGRGKDLQADAAGDIFHLAEEMVARLRLAIQAGTDLSELPLESWRARLNTQTLSPCAAEALLFALDRSRQAYRQLQEQQGATDTEIQALKQDAQTLRLTDETRQAQMLRLENARNSLVEEISHLQKANLNYIAWAQDLEKQLADAREQLAAIAASRSWKATLPFRELKRWVSRPGEQSGKYLHQLGLLGRRVYDCLPLSFETRMRHRGMIAKVAPSLLRAPDIGHGSPSPSRDWAAEIYAVDNAQAFAGSLDLTLPDQPVVSVIIPVYGQVEFTLRCLASISRHMPQTPFEIIIVDDASPDRSAEILEAVNNIRLVRQPTNEGFIRACNAGAREARGQYLCFLNNDTQVAKGWLDELVRTFDEFPGTGLAGSKLLYPDGTLQEAGCIVWQDASAWNFGRGEDPSLPVYNYAREVDYCSGASIMTPKTLFESLGGFDEHYLPAYAEDADLALKIRDKGFRVVYQPLSVVHHFEGATAGRDTSKGVKAHQVANLRKLHERWRGRLVAHQPNGHNVDAAKDRRATKRALVLDLCTPTPDRDSGSIDAYNWMLILREMDFQVTFIPEDNFLYMPPYTQDLQRIGVEVLYAPFTASVKEHLIEHGRRYDLVFLFRVAVVQRNLSDIRRYCPAARILFNTVDLHYLRLEREALLEKDDQKMQFARDLKKLEYDAIRSVDAATVVSAEEHRGLREALPDAPLHLLPFTRHIEGPSAMFRQRRDIVFVGGFKHPPNTDAVLWFASAVFPKLKDRLPDVRFYIVGADPPPEVQKLAGPDRIVTGFVQDLSSLLGQMRVSVAPIRYGAGIKGKIGTALAAGLPVVATSAAAEGMNLVDGRDALIADDPDEFALKIEKLYCDERLWRRISESGLAFARGAWGAEQGWRNLETILRTLGFESVSRRYPLKLYTESLASRQPFQASVTT